MPFGRLQPAHIGAVAACTALALLLQLAPFETQPGVFLTAAALPPLVAAFLLGPWAGLIATLPASILALTLQPQTPIFQDVLLLITPPLLGWLANYSRPVVAGLVYWLLIAVTLWLLATTLDFAATDVISLMFQLLTGLLFVVIADLIAQGIKLRAWEVFNRSPRSPTIRELLMETLLHIGLAPLLLIALASFWTVSNETHRQLSHSQQRTANLIERAVSDFIQTRIAALEIQAKYVQPKFAGFRSNWETLDDFRTAFPEFVSMLIADSNGQLLCLQFSDDPKTDERFVQSGDTVVDRDYFQVVKANKTPFISDAFQGRGLGSELIVALSVPLFSDPSQQNFVGILEGSLQLNELYNYLPFDAARQGNLFVVLDSSNKVIATNAPKSVFKLDKGELLASAQTPLLAAKSNPNSFGWSVEGYYSDQLLIDELSPFIAWTLGVLIPVLGLVVLIARRLTDYLSRPIETLADTLQRRREASSRIKFAPIRIPPQAPREYIVVAHQANQLLSSLEASHMVLSDSLATREQLNRSLHDTLDSMDRKVRERTEELSQALQDAERANREKNRFLANTSHEIRTPMHAIMGMAELLTTSELNEEQQERVRLILNASENMLALIDEILDFSAIEAGKLSISPVPTNLLSLLRQSADLLRPKFATQNRELHIDLQVSAALYCQIDPLRLRQVVLNLLNNAFNHAGKSDVWLSARVDRDNQTSSLCGHLELSVADAGPGIPQDQIENVFIPFEQVPTAEGKPKGSGLGLAVSRRIANLMHGSLSLSTSAYGGCEFTLKMPLPNADMNPESEATKGEAIDLDLDPPTLEDSEKTTILVADDNLVNRRMLAQQLAYLGFSCEEAVNGQEVLDAFAKAQFDVLLLDCQMPDVDGFEVTERLRESDLPQPFIVAVTASASKGFKEKCLAIGMDDYISKPARLADIRRVLSVWQRANTETAPETNSSHPTDRVLDHELLASWAKVAEVSGGNLYQEMILPLTNTLHSTIDSYRKLIEANELERLAKASHQLRGKLANLGGVEAVYILNSIEERVRQVEGEQLAPSERESLEDLIDQLSAAANRLIAAFAEYFESTAGN